MTTTQNPDATPGTLKAALALWMALMAGLLGYSIATGDEAADDTHVVEGSGDHEEEGEAATSPEASPAASPSPSPAASPT